MPFQFALVSVLVIGIALGGCDRGQVGLANAPSGNRMSQPRATHDSVANGRESCETTRIPSAGPLRNRLPPCDPPEAEPSRGPGATPP